MANREIKNETTSKQKNTKKLIYSAAFAAIYIVVMVIVVMTSAAIPVLYLATPLIVGIVLSTIFMLAVLRTKSILPIVIMGVGYLVCTGMSRMQTAAMEIIVTAIACLIFKSGNFTGKKTYILGYTVFNLNMAAPFIMLLTARERYFAQLEQYSGQAAREAIESVAGNGVYFVILALAVIGGLLGALLAFKLIGKHFEKAGVI